MHIYIYAYIYLHVCFGFGIFWELPTLPGKLRCRRFFSGSSEAMKLKRQEELLRASEATLRKRCQWRVTGETVG